MVVTLGKTKEWLRVESNDEDALIERFILLAENIVEDILRFPLSEFETVPEPVNHAIYFGVSKFFESRNELDVGELTDTIKKILFGYRRESW
ncbi:MAG: phage gp6-like head-tail connector protein [Eubacteriaceae bacterium]|nr:phage gp6-like head-tail connector protein [Eubacteriaceae bacterium]